MFLPGFFEIVDACVKDVPMITEAFRTGKGVGWHEHDHSLFAGTERFFRPNYRAHLIHEWIPALGDVEARLQSGVRVADVGCGLGSSTILMAQAYPKSTPAVNCHGLGSGRPSRRFGPHYIRSLESQRLSGQRL
ncbi:MAG TPA: hypothetical protein VNE63_12445 [Candidatus Acidoferrales bacterium]|nr:hypothetical protein [Candidatus Acidoferrales bacterium]